jgi:hypothetical protein
MTRRQELPPSSALGAEVVAILKKRQAALQFRRRDGCPPQAKPQASPAGNDTAAFTRTVVITGLVPVIPIAEARRSADRDGRDKPGHDAPTRGARGPCLFIRHALILGRSFLCSID